MVINAQGNNEAHSTEPGTALLLAAAPAGKAGLIDAVSVLPTLAAVPPGVLTGTAAASVVELADPLDPQAVLTRLRTAAAQPGPLHLYVAGQLHLDQRQRLLHLALARTTPSTLRYTGLPWHWLTGELTRRRPHTTTVVLDLVADAEAFKHVGAGGLGLGHGTSLFGRVQPPPPRRTTLTPTYLRAYADIWRTGARPTPPDLHETAASHAGGPADALFVSLGSGYVPAPPDGRPTGGAEAPEALAVPHAPATSPTPAPAGGHDAAPGPLPTAAPAVGEAPGQGPAPAADSTPIPVAYPTPDAAPLHAPPLESGATPAAVPTPDLAPTPVSVQTPNPTLDSARAAIPASAPSPSPSPTSAPSQTPTTAPVPAPASPPAEAPAPTPEPLTNAAPGPAAAAVSGPVAAHVHAPDPGPAVQLGKAAAPSHDQAPAQVPAPGPAVQLAKDPVLSPVAPPPPPVAAPVSTQPAVPPTPAAAPAQPAEPDPHALLLAAVQAGRHGEAASIAAAWEGEALRVHGMRSSQVVHWMEVRADLARLADEPGRSCELWIAVAHARMARGESPSDEDVEAAVDRAHHQFEQVRDPERARGHAAGLTALREQVPGRRPGALDAIKRRLDALSDPTRKA